ncbi:MAG TPA: hypothetical protein VHL09_00620 [Dehalococcoidia bacterium]|nr:hypothetical protein [Dehalococcoidia bacterium]
MSGSVRPEDRLADLIYRYYYQQLSGALGDLRLFNDGYALFERLSGKHLWPLMEQDLTYLLQSGPIAFVARQLFGSEDYRRLINLARSLERVKTAIDSIIARLAPEVGSAPDDELIGRYERAMTETIPEPEALRIVDDVAHGMLVANEWFHPRTFLQRGRRVLIETLIDRVVANEAPPTILIKNRILDTVREDRQALPELARRFQAVEQTYLRDLYQRHGQQA